MSCAVSISDAPEDVWLIQNRIFEWFSGLVRERHHDQADIVEQMQLGEALHGISLDSLLREAPETAMRLRDAMRAMAQEVATGKLMYPHQVADQSDFNRRCKSAFVDLVRLLDRSVVREK